MPCKVDDRYSQRHPLVPTKSELKAFSNICRRSFEGVDKVMQSDVVNGVKYRPLSSFVSPGRPLDEASESPVEEKSAPDGAFKLPEGIGAWPQRLLHVPSMVSFEWQPGNVYGGHAAPTYNAISYTWGRFAYEHASKEGERQVYERAKHVNIDVQNHWPIPRIAPQHFTLHDFENVIKKVCSMEWGEPVEFLWLDVACIDQNDGPQKDVEVGRQAQIFRFAQNVIVWLTRVESGRLSECWSILNEAAKKVEALLRKPRLPLQLSLSRPCWVVEARQALDALFIDPWFTSLWTLQEAYLCPHAYLVPRSGVITLGVTLHDLVDLCHLFETAINLEHPIASTFYHFCRTHDLDLEMTDAFFDWEQYLSKLQTTILNRGMSALAGRNPLALYSISQYRTCSKDWDRVYGIQQVFDIDVRTQPRNPESGAPQSPNKSLFHLELALGTRILRKFPIRSQMQVLTEPVEPPNGWRINPHSRMPTLDIGPREWNWVNAEVECELSTAIVGGSVFATFKGSWISFEKLASDWKVKSDLKTGQSPDLSPQQIFLDSVLSLKDIEPFIPSRDGDELGPEWSAARGRSRDVMRHGDQQHRLAGWLVQHLGSLLKSNSLTVLKLGRICADYIGEGTDWRENILSSWGNVLSSWNRYIDQLQEEEWYEVGLICVQGEHKETAYRRRIGFCIWLSGDAATQHSEWETTKCLLG